MINNKFFEYILTALLFCIFLYYFYYLDKGMLLKNSFPHGTHSIIDKLQTAS